MTTLQLQTIIRQVKKDMDSVGIPYDKNVPITVNKRLKRALGVCKSRNNKAYAIELSGIIIASDLQELKNTICHELIHSATVGDNHGGKWRYYANKMTNSSNYTITRLHDGSKLNQSAIMKTYKYKVTCSKCGTTTHYSKKTSIIKTIMENDGNGYPWYCSKCHGSHWTVEEL